MKEIFAFILLTAHVSLQIYMGFYSNDVTYFIGEQYCYIFLLIVAYLRPQHFVNIIYISIIFILTGLELRQEHAGQNLELQPSDKLNLVLGAVTMIVAIVNKVKALIHERNNRGHT